MLKQDLEQLIAAWLDMRLTEEQSQQLQQELLVSAEARETFRRFSALDSAIRRLAGDEDQSVDAPIVVKAIQSEAFAIAPTISSRVWGSSVAMKAAALTCGVLLVSAIAYWLGRLDSTGTMPVASKAVATTIKEQTISGHATLRRTAGVQWSPRAKAYREGDVLPGGKFEFETGVVEIDFFCGATVVVEGPAALDLENDWSARLLLGRLRAAVPPAAQGFVVKAADSEIVDLGTEFALQVSSDGVRVKVVDGEVKLRGGDHDGLHLFAGEGRSLKGAEVKADVFAGLSTIGDVQRRRDAEQKSRFNAWTAWSRDFRKDERLIAYFAMAELTDRDVPNLAPTGNEFDGRMVGPVNKSDGRFGSQGNGLGFYRSGSRVRARIDGEFKAFTFASWVRIDGLDHHYNALFMGDGYEDGEPHWQIRQDGRLMFSVMVNDNPPPGSRVDNHGNIHHIYFTEPIWDRSMKGQWIHLASVYDPVNRMVTQYLNGQEIAAEAIEPRFYIQRLRIGASEIGNWGQPFRNSPSFSVRNLNGVIDEMAIFKSALDADEVKVLYKKSVPSSFPSELND